MLSQPIYKLLHFCVPPHPTWEVVEDADWDTPAPMRMLPDVVVNVACIWPVGFDGDDVEAMPLDEMLGYGCTSTVEL